MMGALRSPRVRLVGVAEHVQRVSRIRREWTGWVEAILEGPQGQCFRFRDGDNLPTLPTPQAAKAQAARLAAGIEERWGRGSARATQQEHEANK